MLGQRRPSLWQLLQRDATSADFLEHSVPAPAAPPPPPFGRGLEEVLLRVLLPHVQVSVEVPCDFPPCERGLVEEACSDNQWRDHQQRHLLVGALSTRRRLLGGGTTAQKVTAQRGAGPPPPSNAAPNRKSSRKPWKPSKTIQNLKVFNFFDYFPVFFPSVWHIQIHHLLGAKRLQEWLRGCDAAVLHRR